MEAVTLMAITPTVNRLQLGSLLRHFREEARLTQEQLGARIFPKVSAKVQQTRIAKVESGERQLHEADLRSILDICQVTSTDQRALIDQLHANAAKRGRWSGYRAIYRENFRKYVDLETDTTWIRECALEVVPDLCQTEAYARALFGMQYEQGLLPENDFQVAVQARVARQEVIKVDRSDGQESAVLHVVASESSFRRIVGNRAIMREQLAHVVRLSQQSNITFQVLPFHAPVHGVSLSRCSILRVPVPGLAGDLDFVYTRVGNDPRYLDDKPSVQWNEHNFQALSMSALPPHDSRVFLREIEREYR